MSEPALDSSFQVTVHFHGGGIMLFGVTGSTHHKAAEKWLPRLISFHEQVATIVVDEIEPAADRKIRHLSCQMAASLHTGHL